MKSSKCASSCLYYNEKYQVCIIILIDTMFVIVQDCHTESMCTLLSINLLCISLIKCMQQKYDTDKRNCMFQFIPLFDVHL